VSKGEVEATVAVPIVGEPFTAVYQLDDDRSGRRLSLGVLLAVAAHVAAVASPMWSLFEMRASLAQMDRRIVEFLDQSYTIEISEPEEPEPEPEPIQEDVQPEPETPAEPDVSAPELPKPLPTPPPTSSDPDPYDELPSPAEAADVITREPADGEPVDLGWTIVDKDGSTSPGGGYTSARGKSKRPVRDPRAALTGKADARPAPPPPRKKNCARAAQLISSRSWNCPFPAAADVAQIDRAVVLVSVTLNTAGKPSRVNILRDPGYGFGAAARRCAYTKSYRPARDEQCRPIASTTPTIRVLFRR
jgi:protein TonB